MAIVTGNVTPSGQSQSKIDPWPADQSPIDGNQWSPPLLSCKRCKSHRQLFCHYWGSSVRRTGGECRMTGCICIHLKWNTCSFNRNSRGYQSKCVTVRFTGWHISSDYCHSWMLIILKPWANACQMIMIHLPSLPSASTNTIRINKRQLFIITVCILKTVCKLQSCVVDLDLMYVCVVMSMVLGMFYVYH